MDYEKFLREKLDIQVILTSSAPTYSVCTVLYLFYKDILQDKYIVFSGILIPPFSESSTVSVFEMRLCVGGA